MPHGFCHHELRTTDVPGARAFYAAVLGRDDLDIGPLPAQAAARGAPAHWLGHVAVDDVEATMARLVTAGAQRLGPTRPADGHVVAGLRDPLGAVLAVTSRPDARDPAIAWHELHTTDHRRAAALYADQFGWRLTGTTDLGDPLGEYQRFSFTPDGPDHGGMVSSARLPGVHTHWLPHFTIPDLDRATATITRLGGRVIHVAPPFATCEDPQGAAFAIRA